MKPIVLDNGLRVHLVPFAGTEATAVLALVRVGSRYERPEINGAAHFIEHLMFKGTDRHPGTADLAKLLDAVGAEYNAFTGKQATGYHIKIDGRHAGLAIDLLHDMMFKSLYRADDMDRERKVIKEEINMYEDNPLMHVEELLEGQMFAGNPLGWNIAGDHHTMDTMTRDNVIAFRDAHYVPSRTVLAIAGKIDETVLDTVKRTFGSVPASSGKPTALANFVHPTTRARQASIQKKDTQQLQVMLGFPSCGIDDPRRYAIDLLAAILGGSMSSRLFLSVREQKGLAYLVRASQGGYEETGLLTIQAGLDKSRLPLAIATIREELARMKSDGVTPRELQEAVDHFSGKMMLKLEDSAERADWYAAGELLENKVETVEEWLAHYQTVKPEDVLKVANEVLDESKMGVAAIGPFENGEAFLKEAGLNS